MLIPYQVDVPMKRWPVANFAIIGLTVFVFFGLISTAMRSDDLGAFESMVLNGWDVRGMFGHIFLHAGWMHLFGNMLFLWVFGNAICAKIGNVWYPVLYLGLGLFAAATHNIFSSGLMVGASGAINGIVGLFLIWYPINSVSCFYLFIFRPGSFSISSYWMILLWLVFDILGLATGGEAVAYWAHIGGFAVGVVTGIALLKSGIVEMESTEKSLLDLMARNTEE